MDMILAEAGITRRIGFTSPHFTAALATVAATDMVTTISESFARHMAPLFDLVIKPVPFAASTLAVVLGRSPVREHDPLHIWFRGIVKDAAEVAVARGAAGMRQPARGRTRLGL